MVSIVQQRTLMGAALFKLLPGDKKAEQRSLWNEVLNAGVMVWYKFPVYNNN